MPRPVHAHVRPEDEASGQPHQEVLAARFNPFDHPAAERAIVVYAREVGKDRFKPGDRAARERAVQRAGRTEYSVAFGHIQLTAGCWQLAAARARNQPAAAARRPILVPSR